MSSKTKLIDVMEGEFSNSDATEVVEWLYNRGIIDDKNVTHYLIKREYHQRLKGRNKSCFEIKSDLAEQFLVSDSTVRNIIYAYDHIKV